MPSHLDDNAARRPRAASTAWMAVLALAALPLATWAQSNDDCLMCHSDPQATGTRDGATISVYVDPQILGASVHRSLECIGCHADLKGAELPHAEELARVQCSACHEEAAADMRRSVHANALRCSSCHGTHNVAKPPRGVTAARMCGECHPQQAAQHLASLHGRAAAAGDALAPSCVTCHGHHQILSHLDPSSPTTTMNIPQLCGQCHHEGTPVSLQHNIPQARILENYSESIHGEGLFKKGLSVTAVCTSCHTSHYILEHTDPRSSINRNNVAKTCTACHARIEQVHVKVIEGRLWEQEPHKIPSCVECHSPHRVRKQPLVATGAANEDCLTCHSNRDLAVQRGGRTISLYVDEQAYATSTHSKTACAQCHTLVDPTRKRPCEPIRPVDTVDCSICHAEQVQQHATSIHGRLAAEGDADAPECLDCHEKHATQSHRLPTSKTYPRNIPELCARCHREGERAARRIHSDLPNPVKSYTESIHGKGLVESGLVVSATCTDCHTSHHPLPPDDPESSVNPAHIADTCGTCHNGIFETFKKSVHWPANTDSKRPLPTCEACHTSHTITRTDLEGFRMMMMNQCGRCHTEEATTFFDTYHGKVSRLGSEGAAKCYDCHGTHDILPPDNPDSRLSRVNVVKTCAKCHPGAHRRFAGYLTHATHHDQKKYPYLFYAFWFMTTLLVGTLSFFILHTVAWLWRLSRTREQWAEYKALRPDRYYQRFSRAQRIMHLIMLLSFFTLALTGMALKFSYMRWAMLLSEVLGGFEVMGILHRIGAMTLVGLFIFHLRQVWQLKRQSGRSWLRFIFGPGTMMFTLDDIRQAFASARWFLGLGPRPRYGRFTYWEKFDYFAVFWGVIIIGSTGLVLWFPELFTRALPGWSVNVATIIHSDEALLAVAFIFTIHFFNTHFRPDKFPMDPVIFTGRVGLDELKHDKPGEYEELTAGRTEEEVQAQLVPAFEPRAERAARIFGFTALGIGLTLIFLILYTMLFGYR